MTLPEEYLRGNLELHLHIWNWRRESIGSDYCIMYYPYKVNSHFAGDIADINMIRAPWMSNDMFGQCNSNGQDLMLISVIEIGDGLEGQLMTTMPSIVRLQPLNCCLGLTGETAYTSFSDTFEVASAITDREHSVLVA